MPEEIMKQNQIYIITSQDIISLREEYALEVAHLKSLIFLQGGSSTSDFCLMPLRVLGAGV